MSDTRQKTNASGILTIGDYELGIQSGEIIDERNITREIAIQKLKEAKELLDLGIYTPSQYEAEKKKYTPYIINQ